MGKTGTNRLKGGVHIVKGTVQTRKERQAREEDRYSDITQAVNS